MLAGDQEDKVRDRLTNVYRMPDIPSSFAAFIRHEADGRLHCEVKIYFSPAASEIARSFNARACGTPSPIGLSLLAGSEDAHQTLFPET